MRSTLALTLCLMVSVAVGSAAEKCKIPWEVKTVRKPEVPEHIRKDKEFKRSTESMSCFSPDNEVFYVRFDNPKSGKSFHLALRISELLSQRRTSWEDLPSQPSWAFDAAEQQGASISPDGNHRVKLIEMRNRSGRYWPVYELDGAKYTAGSSVPILNRPTGAKMSWSPDSKSLLIVPSCTESEASLVDISGNICHKFGVFEPLWSPLWSNDSKRIIGYGVTVMTIATRAD